MAKGAKKETHFYPLTLNTYQILPPPETVGGDIGEQRVIQHLGAQAVFGEEVHMEKLPVSSESDKHLARQERADYIHSIVADSFSEITRR